jgi:hypothetical protein
MVGFVNFHKVVIRKNAFLDIPSASNWIGKIGKKWRVEMPILTNGRRFGSIKNP